MEVYGKYEMKDSHDNINLALLVAAVLDPASTAIVNETGGAVSSSMDVSEALNSLFDGKSEEGERPAADLNYILFDQNLNPVDFDYDRIDEEAGFAVNSEHSVDFSKMELDKVADRIGYVFVYVSNESPGSRVWMDDVGINIRRSQVVQFEDYYPFGLSMEGTAFERGTENYRGMVTPDGTGLNPNYALE